MEILREVKLPDPLLDVRLRSRDKLRFVSTSAAEEEEDAEANGKEGEDEASTSRDMNDRSRYLHIMKVRSLLDALASGHDRKILTGFYNQLF